jgi:hypothetical protein
VTQRSRLLTRMHGMTWVETQQRDKQRGTGRTAIKSILIVGARVVRNLKTGAPLVGIFEQVDIRLLVEAVVRGVVCRRAVEVMDVAIPGIMGQTDLSTQALKKMRRTHKMATFSSPGRQAILRGLTGCMEAKEESESLQDHALQCTCMRDEKRDGGEEHFLFISTSSASHALLSPRAPSLSSAAPQSPLHDQIRFVSLGTSRG